VARCIEVFFWYKLTLKTTPYIKIYRVVLKFCVHALRATKHSFSNSGAKFTENSTVSTGGH
jgi:hypothetical protein